MSTTTMTTTSGTGKAQRLRGNSHQFNYLFITNKRSHYKLHAHSVRKRDGEKEETLWTAAGFARETKTEMCILRSVASSSFVHMPSIRALFCLHSFHRGYVLWTCGAMAIGAIIVKCVHVAVIVCHRFARTVKLLKMKRGTDYGVWSSARTAYTFSAIFQNLSIDGTAQTAHGRNGKRSPRNEMRDS